MVHCPEITWLNVVIHHHLQSPRLTVIVVKKRVNARFFTQSGGRIQNPLPGTVIDVEVTRPEWYDFFIVSQAVRSGSVSPTHYNVIYDSSGLKPDHIQRLTYKLCHIYYNWPGVIRVPAPCQYAHKLAFLVGQSIHREPNLSLSNRLYYLWQKKTRCSRVFLLDVLTLGFF